MRVTAGNPPAGVDDKAPPPPEELGRYDGGAEVSWLGVVARGAFPGMTPVAHAAELALTVAGAAPVSHRTSLSHRGPTLTRGRRGSYFGGRLTVMTRQL